MGSTRPESTLARLLRTYAWLPAPPAQPTLERTLIDKAKPDECFLQIGYPSRVPPCTGESRPKVNQAYIGSGTRSGNHAWFGTGANVLCMAAAGYFPAEAGGWELLRFTARR